MKIETNISDTDFVHDLIKYKPIQRQLFDMFTQRFPDIQYENSGGLVFVLDGTRCVVEIGTGKKSRKSTVTNAARLSIIAPYPGVRFGTKEYPTVRLPYNEEIDEKLGKFCGVVRKIQDLERRAKALPATPEKKVIEAFLNSQLATDEVVASYWQESLFDGTEIMFYLHPKHSAPGEGVMACIEKGTSKISPYWNGSNERRSKHYGNGESLDWAVYRPSSAPRDVPDLASMKAKIVVIETLRAKIDAFDPTKSAEMMRLIDLKKRGDELLEEFQAIGTKTKK